MKLLFVSNLFPDLSEPRRGLDNATLLHHLGGKWEIQALALRPTLPFRATKARVHRPEDAIFTPEFLEVPYVPRVGSRVNHSLYAASLRKALRSKKERFSFDVILGSWIYPDCCALARIARESGQAFVAIAQGSDVHQYLEIPTRRRIILREMASASAIVTRSRELGRLLANAGIPSDKLHTVYN